MNPEIIKQISVYLENKPGRLASVCSALAKDKINISAMTVAEHRDRSVLRLVTDDMAKTRNVLKKLNVETQIDDVVLVLMSNKPGALAHVCEQLAGEHISIDYAYCNATGKNGKSVAIFKVSNAARCLKLLAETPTKMKRNGHGGRGWSRSGRTEKTGMGEEE